MRNEIPVRRTISIMLKPPEWEEVKEIELKDLSIVQIMNAGLNPKSKGGSIDCFFLCPYLLNEEQLREIEPFLNETIEYNFDKYIYVLEAEQAA